MKILIVDDLATNRKLLRVQLEEEGHGVIEAVDGIEALEVLGREIVDAVISDILMPRMDGYRLCHEVRKDPKLLHLRFLLYSSTYTAPADVKLSSTVGADNFVAKPAPVAVLLKALEISANNLFPPALPEEAIILEQYSSVLVAKLEERNAELAQALKVSREGAQRVLELNFDLERRVATRTAELASTNKQLSTALAEVKQLTGLLPICSYCRNIRDEKGDWDNVEVYILKHTDSRFSHSVCATCHDKHVVPMLKEIGIRPPAPAESQPIS
jgi:CheY-like chemotaxis protein